MNDHEWNELNRMHREITLSGIPAFDTKYLEQYTELLTKSLQGKGDMSPGDTDIPMEKP